MLMKCVWYAMVSKILCLRIEIGMGVVGKDTEFRLVMNIEGGSQSQHQSGLLNRQGKEDEEMAGGKSGQGKTGRRHQASAKQGVECRECQNAK